MVITEIKYTKYKLQIKIIDQNITMNLNTFYLLIDFIQIPFTLRSRLWQK